MPTKVSAAKAQATKGDLASNNQQLLTAGAILLSGAELPADTNVAAQEVRSFHHAVLGERTIAKVTSVDLAPAVDATMDFLGFGEPQSSGVIGVALHGALGFPESALIADPKNARYALALTKDLGRFARMAKGRPGAAKEGMEALGATLAKSVPLFLPSYFEQCGRIFIARDNVTYGGAMFVKARAAEATYGLKINEEQRRAAFLEFAFAGSLPAKALDDYAKDLAKAYPAKEAFEHFRSLALQRSRGGLAPWAQMMDAVKRMAKAASVDVEAAQSELLAELIGSPSLRFASHTFWKSIRALLVKNAKEDPATQGALLNLSPSGDFDAWWLEMLSDSGALDALFALNDDDVPVAARPNGGPAGWLNNFIEDNGSKFDLLPSLLTRMAPRLKKDAVPIQFHSWWMNLDVFDLALELGITCAPSDRADFAYPFDDPFARPLTFLAATTNLAPAIRNGVLQHVDEHAKRMYAAIDLRPFLADWIGQRVEAIAPTKQANGSGVFDFADSVSELIKAATPEMLSLVDHANERLAAADPAAAFQRQLNAGVFAEYTWPALEQAAHSLLDGMKKLKNDDDCPVHLLEAWPYAILHDQRRAIVVDHNGIVLEHDLQWADTWNKHLAFADGALYVGWSDWSTGTSAYWSNDAAAVTTSDDIDIPYRNENDQASLQLADGGRTSGGKAFRLGDLNVGSQNRVLCDGTNYWRYIGTYVNDDWTYVYIEYDPQTGKTGRQSWPSFVEQHLAANRTITHAELMPLPVGLEATPLGTANGLLGTVTTQYDQEGQRHEIVRIDGKRAEKAYEGYGTGIPRVLMDWPGVDHCYLVTDLPEIVDPASDLTITDRCTFSQLRGLTIPALYFHHFTVRDPKGSEALRSVVAKDLVDLLTEAQRLVDNSTATAQFGVDTDHLPLLPAVSQALPQVSAHELLADIARIATKATVAKTQLDQWLSGVQAVGSAAAFSAFDEDAEKILSQATTTLLHTSYGMRLRTQLNTLNQFLSMPSNSEIPELEYDVSSSLESDGLTPASLLDKVPAVVYRLLLNDTLPEEREALFAYLDAWLDSPAVAHGNITFEELLSSDGDDPEGTLRWGPDGSHWWCSVSQWESDLGDESSYKVDSLGYGNQPERPEAFTRSAGYSTEPYVETNRVREFVDLVRERGLLPAMDAAAVELFAATTGCSKGTAAVVLGGFRGSSSYGGGRDLTKEDRDRLGIKANEVKNGSEEIANQDSVQRARMLIMACYPEDLTLLWTLTALEFATRLAACWIEVFGTQAIIEDELLSSINKMINPGWTSLSPRELLEDMAGIKPKYAPSFVITFDSDGDVCSEPDSLDTNWIEATMRASAALTYDLPVGSPWRQVGAVGIVKLLERLHDPALVISWSETTSSHGSFKRLTQELPVIEQTGDRTLYDAADMIVVNATDHEGKPTEWKFFLRPHLYTQPSQTRALANSLLDGSNGDDDSALHFMDWLFSPRAEQFAQRIIQTTLPEGSWEQNPLLSAPTIVAAAAEELVITEDAAVLYLQLLTLPDPTSANIRLWNAWTPKQLTTATEALVGKELVIEAKRKGTGREVFLPGGWVEMNAPAMGIEDWKLPFYAIAKSGGTKRTSYLSRVLPLDPVHQLFEQAWQRVQSGDRPGFAAAGRGLGERKTKGKS
jgi:hypothetical protein